MAYILFSPIGYSDPIRGNHDGAWLNICRRYKPKLCEIYLTSAMCAKEDTLLKNGERLDLYARTLELLNNKLFGDEREKYIKLRKLRDTELVSAHSLELFFPKFGERLRALHDEFPNDKLLVNVTSGSAGMQVALMCLNALLPFPITVVQVANHSPGQQTEAVKDNYDVELEWLCNEDNEVSPEKANRCSEQPMLNFMREMLARDIGELMDRREYYAASITIKRMSERFSHKAHTALKGAELRSNFKLKEAGECLRRAGFAQGAALKTCEQDKVAQCAEYLLLMENDIRRGNFFSMLCRTVPLLVNMCEQYLLKLGYDIRKNGVINEKWRRDHIPDEWRRVLDASFGCFRDGERLSHIALIPLIEKFGETEAYNLALRLRGVVEDARNLVAHKIVALDQNDVINKTKLTPEQIIELFKEFLSYIRVYPQEYWNSYEDMNAHIRELLSI